MHLDPNRIYHLPVRITYTLPATCPPLREPDLLYATGFPCTPRRGADDHVTYTTTARGLVPVFVHEVQEFAAHGRKRRRSADQEEGETRGEQTATVCLKGLVKAVLLASPEIIPSRHIADLKIYIPVYAKSPTSSRRSRASRGSVGGLANPESATPNLSSGRTRSSSSSIPETEIDIKPTLQFGYPYSGHPPFGKPIVHDDAQHGWPVSSPHTAHAHLTTPHQPLAAEEQQILQPKSTVASVLCEKNSGKTTVTGRLVHLTTSEMLDSVISVDEDQVPGVVALQSLVASGIEAVLDVRLVLEVPITVDGSGAVLDLERERAVYDALGLGGETTPPPPPPPLVKDAVCSGDVEMYTSDLVKVEPDWVESSSPVPAKSKTEVCADRFSAHPPAPEHHPSFRSFRPTDSKMAIFQSQTRKRKRGVQGRRGFALHSAGLSDTDPASPTSSHIFSRTRSRTRVGGTGGTTMLEQVVNVDNVVRLARKNPAALVERFLSGQPATSPVKHRSKSGGVSIDSVPPRVGRGAAGGVKTLNIATGSSKKRKVVSVVLDDEGRPVRWGAGMTATAAAATTVQVDTNNRGREATSTMAKPGAHNNNTSAPEPLHHFGRNLPICSNCGITESSSWRTKGKGGQRVCNACGLYWNNKGKMRPKELWEKDIARWKKRRAKAAEKSANAGTSTTTGTPAPTSTSTSTAVKSEPVSARRPSMPTCKVEVAPLNSNIATMNAGLKRNLSAVAEKEAQLRAGHRKSHATGPWPEQLAHSGTKNDKENGQSLGHPSVPIPAHTITVPAHRTATSALQPLDPNGNTVTAIPLLQQIKESPEAVLKRYLGETPFSLVPANHMPLSDDGSRSSRANTRKRSPATSPTEVGSVRLSQEDPLEWGTAPDLAGLFKLSQQAESVVSLAATGHLAREQAEIGGHLGSDETAMMDGDNVQNVPTQPELTDLEMHIDSLEAGLPSAPCSRGSSPTRQPFDWTNLPPSSPPVMYEDEVDHAAALWSSSPETSPVDFGTISVKEISPMKPVGEEMQVLLQSLEKSAQAEALRLINGST
ncbi:hypothetical protein NliqN6_4256 [Naganishia liquefaciens]|uniref:GATA-type domain-containing protein n=1 Tax=Naganishia liquefaciens TaxID=104408 RepID=A0A8H3TVI6_9TREE|nr:hypothetical protein NliqN6_4256 [Naganishia liquefaciens]